ncbi:MAG: glycosyltransferase family 9 protein [Alphaproteobacteria bacterium]|nr:glycosyltransferase family 9 protein [Alphaproteobacteria bacterium]
MMMAQKNILVIRLGALGDILLCMKPFQDIRVAHKDANITLLTMPAFAGLARQMPWFDEVIEDTRPEWWQWKGWMALRQAIVSRHFDIVIDLQNKPRTRFYRDVFFGPKIQWSSSTGNSTYPLTVFEKKMHRQDELLVQLRQADISDSGVVDLNWLSAPIGGLNLPPRYVVLVPGCSPHLLHKRWPPQAYAQLARYFEAKNCGVVVVGTKADAQSIAAIKANADFIIDLSGQTSFAQLANLYHSAVAVVGNDTGPTFLAAMVGAPTLTLMSHHTDPVRSGPVGPKCAWLKEEIIADITVEAVQAKLAELIS